MNEIIEKGLPYLEQTEPFLYRMLLHHRTHKNELIRFGEGRKYLIDIYLDKSLNIVIMKCTQASISEWLIGYTINESIIGNNVLYVLPTEVIRTRFVSARFNKTIDFTPIYSNQGQFNSINLKSFGTGIINFIGSNATSGFAEFVAHTVIKDEVDYCNQQNLKMAVERQSAQIEKKNIDVGNPTIEDKGISFEYSKSDKKKWHIECNHCSHKFIPDFFKHVVEKIENDYVLLDRKYERGMKRDIYCICEKCGKPFDRFSDGEWVKENNYSEISGYHISKMFSTKVKIKELVDRFEEGLIKPIVLQRFYNGDMGLPFTSEGARISKNMLKEISYRYNLQESSKNPCVCGIDVGNSITTIIGEIKNIGDEPKIKIIFAQDLNNENDIIEINRRFNIVCGVIDMRPEIRLSRRVVATFKRWWMIDYLTESAKDMIDENRKIFKTDRTTSLDELKASISLGFFEIPECLLNDDIFVSQIEASTRIWEENESHIEGGRYVWTEGNKPDHRLHAWNYMNLAYKLIKMYKG